MSNASRKITPAAAVAAIKEHGGLRPAARALGVDNGWLCRIAKRANGVATSAKVAPPAPDIRDGFSGVAGFAALHAPEARQRRHDEATRALIEKFIAGPLKSRGWYYDQDAARAAGVGSQDWARFRDDYSRLIVSVRVDAGSRNEKLCWCHPDCVEDMRAIAEGRKTV